MINSYFPILLYFPICFFVFIKVSGRNMFKNHTAIILFLFFMLPGILNIYTQQIFYDSSRFYFRAIDFISLSEINRASWIYIAQIILCVLAYFYFYKRKKISFLISNQNWAKYTKIDYIRYNNALFFAGISCYFLYYLIRFGYYGVDNAYAPARAVSEELIYAASYGKSQALAGIFLSTSTVIFFILLEFKSNWRAAILFSLLILTPLVNASKVGIILPFLYLLLYLFIRSRIRFNYIYIILLAVLVTPSFILGEMSRDYFQGYSLGDITWFSWIEDFSRRDTSIGMTLIMISDPNFYSHLMEKYVYSIFGLAIPSFIWPDKPNTPGYAIASLFGFGVQSAAPGWIGGTMFIFGKYALFTVPIVIGYILSVFSRHFYYSGTEISIKYPILYTILLEVLSWLMDGQYHSIIANIIILLVQFLIIIFFVLLINQAVTIPPIFMRIWRFFVPKN